MYTCLVVGNDGNVTRDFISLVFVCSFFKRHYRNGALVVHVA